MQKQKIQNETPKLADVDFRGIVVQPFRTVSCELYRLELLFATPVTQTGQKEATR